MRQLVRVMAVVEERLYDDGVAEAYREDLYSFVGLARTVPAIRDVGEEEVQFFADEGYLAIENVFTAEAVQDGLDGLLSLLAGDNPDYRGVMYEKASSGIEVQQMSAWQKQDYVRKFMYFVEYHPNLKAMAEFPPLLEVVARLIAAQPALMQDMALLKPPRIGREKPWHQDHAYFDYELATRIVGVWIALDEATVDNGCMIIVPRSHRQGPVVHFRRRDWQICDKDANQDPAVAVPLKPGGALFFSSFMQHGTPTNNSGQRRRALQFHYRPQEALSVTQEERMAVFGAEGKNVTC